MGINPVHPVILSRILDAGLSLKIRRLSFQDVDLLRAMETSKCRRLFFAKEYTWAEKTAYCEKSLTPTLRVSPSPFTERGLSRRDPFGTRQRRG